MTVVTTQKQERPLRVFAHQSLAFDLREFEHPEEVECRELPADLADAAEMLYRHARNGVFVLEGGGDISPFLYGEDVTHAHVYRGSTERDMHEVFLYTVAKRIGMPIFGICRGHQLMAVLEGARLHQDIYAELHQPHQGGTHLVELDFTNPFGQFLATTAARQVVAVDRETHEERYFCWVNSMHHQAVDRNGLPPHMRVAATANPEGFIEALLYPHGASVQWHPEYMKGGGNYVVWLHQHIWAQRRKRRKRSKGLRFQRLQLHGQYVSREIEVEVGVHSHEHGCDKLPD